MTEPYVARILTILLSGALLLGVFGHATAAKKKVDVEVPDRFDGNWSITALSISGPCAKSTSYSVRIKNGDASIPGDVHVDGGVSAGGAVQATIIQGANRAPITGRLDPNGSGSGAWHTSGGLVECSGTWRAKRTG